jgi:hypothetical protein
MLRNWVCVLLMMPALVSGAELKPATEKFYQQYIANVEKKLQERKNFLLVDSSAEDLKSRIKSGEIFVEERRPGQDPPDGIIHHWEGAVFIPSAHVGEVVLMVQNYDNHKNVYTPEVIDSQTLKHDGDDFQIRLRLLKKKVLTVILETAHTVHYKKVNEQSWESVSRSTKINEVDNAGTAKERLMPDGTGHGFVWHLDSFWRFQEADGGVYVECTSVSLSRDIPFGMSRLIRPIISDLPQESLRGVLRNTRKMAKK